MKSSTPKVLHRIAGRPLVYYPIRAAFEAGASRVVVVTSGQPEIEASLKADFDANKIQTVVQAVARGTGDAARIGMMAVEGERVLILCGDAPLVTADELKRVLSVLDETDAQLSLLTCELQNPTGYGRILRDAAGRVLQIREHRDLKSDAERAIREVNAGMYAADSAVLHAVLAEIQPNNAQGEYYLTDAVELIAQTGAVRAVLGPEDALVGVNDRAQLAQVEEWMLARIRTRHAKNGVTVRGDARIEDSVTIDEDASIEAAVSLRGKTHVHAGATIDVGCVITDAEIGARANIKAYSVITSSRVGENAQIGPFAHLRPESDIEADAHIGNFVETKKTRVRRGAKANHLSYLGDGDIGEEANVGAGTIFCNYDGYRKHRTVIGKRAFIGSDSQIVAPVTIGDGAYVATGTTVTSDVPTDAMAIGRVRQENKPEYAQALRSRLQNSAQSAKKSPA
jgi:bifunctional UDP-N-acetylglucosamine pyrophosphorylase/glucosamine-1-phosphate N-acetyltransferase